MEHERRQITSVKSMSSKCSRLSCLLVLFFTLQVSAELVIVHASSESKEYWVPREHVTVGVQSSVTVSYLIQQLCYIFHRSRTMASHKENYPCLSRSNALMLYNPNTKFEYRDTGHTLEGYNMRNGTRLYLFYS